MDFTTLFMGLLFATLIYLHIRQNDLIFQRDIQVAKILAVILLGTLGLKYAPAFLLSLDTYDLEFTTFVAFLYSCSIWVLSILIFWKLLSGCQKDAFFKRIGEPGQSLRKKIKDILLEVIETKNDTLAFKRFFKTRFEDPLLNSISKQCETICCTLTPEGGYTEDQIERLKALSEQLG